MQINYPSLLAHLNTGPVEYYDSLGSTNDLAEKRLTAGAPDLTIILADEQTSGRGRHGRIWHTPPGAALAFSLVLRTPADSPPWAYAPLGALAVHDALAEFGLQPAVKWPNDVLLNGKKTCGVLAEAHWQGSALNGVVLGIGINILPDAVPSGDLNFPATSVSAEAGRPVDRLTVFVRVIEHLIHRRTQIGTPAFLHAWEERLAYRGEEVTIGSERGTLLGLSPEGSLRLLTPTGEKTFPAGELSLRR